MARRITMSRAFMAASLLAMAVPLAAQAPEAGTFYLVIGSDTVSIERTTRLPNHLESRMYDLKRMGRAEFVADLATSGLVKTLVASFFKSDRDTEPVQQTSVRFSGDSAGFTSAGKTNWLHIGANTLPNVNPSMAMM